MDYVKGKRPDGCILCHIINRSPGVVDLTVYENKFFFIVVNLYPYNPGHLMIFPRRHLIDVRELNREEEKMLSKLQRITLDVLDKTHSPCGYNIGYNMGIKAGASIDHLHLHIIPRYRNEIGIADLVAGKRVLVESPFKTAERVKEAFSALRPLKF